MDVVALIEGAGAGDVPLCRDPARDVVQLPHADTARNEVNRVSVQMPGIGDAADRRIMLRRPKPASDARRKPADCLHRIEGKIQRESIRQGRQAGHLPDRLAGLCVHPSPAVNNDLMAAGSGGGRAFRSAARASTLAPSPRSG